MSTTGAGSFGHRSWDDRRLAVLLFGGEPGLGPLSNRRLLPPGLGRLSRRGLALNLVCGRFGTPRSRSAGR